MLLLELDNSDGEDALLLVLGLVSCLVDHQVLSQTHVGAWQGAEDNIDNFILLQLNMEYFHSLFELSWTLTWPSHVQSSHCL